VRCAECDRRPGSRDSAATRGGLTAAARPGALGPVALGMLVAVTDETVPWRPDERLLDGRYRVGQRLGGGAVAEVYRALDERLQRQVAVKLFRGDAAEELQRHEAEMRTLARLDHPSLVAVYDAGTDDTTHQPYLVMQLVEGSTLSDEMRDGPLPADRTARYGAALADALGYVHEQGFVHRDIKPANVLISADGRVHLADFGIARLVDSSHVTKTGEVLGTPAYFAPEQVSGDPVGPPADVYALGMVLLECLSGQRAFEGTAMEVAMARLSRDPEIPTWISPGWRTLLTAMTARQPADRPAATDVATTLRNIGEDPDRTVAMTPAPVVAQRTQVLSSSAPVQRGPAPVVAHRRTGLWVALVAVLIIAAAAIGIAVAKHQNGSAAPANYVPGSPTLHPTQLEDQMQQLEKLVRP
jgi:serine/threonine protein kinase